MCLDWKAVGYNLGKRIEGVNWIMTKYILELSKYLPQIRDVFGLKIYASSSVAPSKVDHAAAVLAEYLDNDQDGVVDEQKVVDSLLAFKSGMVIHKNEAEEVKNMENYSDNQK